MFPWEMDKHNFMDNFFLCQWGCEMVIIYINGLKLRKPALFPELSTVSLQIYSVPPAKLRWIRSPLIPDRVMCVSATLRAAAVNRWWISESRRKWKSRVLPAWETFSKTHSDLLIKIFPVVYVTKVISFKQCFSRWVYTQQEKVELLPLSDWNQTFEMHVYIVIRLGWNQNGVSEAH